MWLPILDLSFDIAEGEILKWYVEEGGKIAGVVRTEHDGYFFFERVTPGRYRLSIDPEQARRLKLCPLEVGAINVGFEADILVRDIEIRSCETATPRIVKKIDLGESGETPSPAVALP